MSQQKALRKAVDSMGGVVKAAKRVGISGAAMAAFLAEDGPSARPLPLDRAMQIERLVGGKVKREELRPDVDWSRPKRVRSGASEQKAA